MKIQVTKTRKIREFISILKKANNQWNVSPKSTKKTIYNKKKQTQAQIYRFINIAKEIVNRSRIKLSGFIELAIAIRHFS